MGWTVMILSHPTLGETVPNIWFSHRIMEPVQDIKLNQSVRGINRTALKTRQTLKKTLANKESKCLEVGYKKNKS